MGDDSPKEREKPTPSLADLINEIVVPVSNNPARRALSLSSESEFDKLCKELGGSLDLGPDIRKSDFQRCCGDYPLSKVLPILLRFTEDEPYARRHWPWIAFAIEQYGFEIEERAKYNDELSPTEVNDLLKDAEDAARKLRLSLNKLQTLGNL